MTLRSNIWDFVIQWKWFVCRCSKRSMYRVLTRFFSSLGGKIQKVMVGVSSADIASLPKRHTGILSFLKVLLRFSQGPGSCGITHRFLAKKSKLTASLLQNSVVRLAFMLGIVQLCVERTESM